MKIIGLLVLFLFVGCSPKPFVPQNEDPNAEQVGEHAVFDGKVELDAGTADEPRDSGDSRDSFAPDLVQPEIPTEIAIESIPEPAVEIVADGGPMPEAIPEATAEALPEAIAEKAPEQVVADLAAGLSCDERLNRANDMIEAQRQQHLSCVENLDCTDVNPSTGCMGACPQPVNTTGKSAVESSIALADQTYCQNYQQDGCPYATPKCVQNAPFCDQNKCVLYGCSERSMRAREWLESERKKHLDCNSKDDCVLFFSGTQCQGACQSVVNKSGETIIKDTLKQIDQTICHNYRQDGCPYATPGCTVVYAKCDNNQCALDY